MLRTRIITALILTVGLFAAVFLLPANGWAWLVASIAGLAGWEFGRLAGWTRMAVVFGAWIFLLCAALTLLAPDAVGAAFGQSPVLLPIFAAASLFWMVVVPLWLRQRWTLVAGSAFVVGTLLLVPTWLALVQLRLLHPWLLVAVMALVAFADIAAYFSGRRFGRRKLAPSISPGKTWEGAYGAVVVVLIYGVLSAWFAGWIDSPLRAAMLVLALPALTFISIAGDLFESLLKRQAGMKDSSQLLPGHGGILDRIDSLTAALPVVALFFLLLA